VTNLNRIWSIGGMLVIIGFAHGTQQNSDAPKPAAKPLTFDAASIKPERGGAGRGGFVGGPGTSDPGRLRYPSITLRALLRNAYGVQDFQVQGPSWLATETFAFDATMPTETTRDDLRTMLRNLLADRFKLKAHQQMSETTGYVLTRLKTDAQLKSQDLATRQRWIHEAEADGFPITEMTMNVSNQAEALPTVWTLVLGGNGGRMGAQQATMQDLSNELTRLSKCLVRDETSLRAKYDFLLKFWSLGFPLRCASDGVALPPPPASLPSDAADKTVPTLLEAMQSQLGLKLDLKKVPVELIVIDHIERMPTDN
jgi:uncharacterized protein (TIGR03435 family)